MKIGYARVSTVDQSVEIQLDLLREAGCEQVFSERVTGTSTTDRHELAKALQFCRAGDTLIVTRLDRLARSMVDLTRIIADLSARGVGFKCIQQAAVDTTDIQGRLMLNILGAVAEFETDLRKARQAEGIAKAKARGVYKTTKKVTEADVIHLRSQGMAANEIAKALKVSRRTVYRMSAGHWGESPFGGMR